MITNLIGHHRQQSELAELINDNKLPHAIFLTGLEGIGKQVFAKQLALSLFCEQSNLQNKIQTLTNCAECHNCRLLNSSNHPDYYQIECRDTQTWNTSAIRNLLYKLHLKPFQNGKRFILFNDVQYLRREACNALLKILEEPPADTYFCLISPNTQSVPATITSRSQIWFFSPLKTDELQAIISNLYLNDAELTKQAQTVLKNYSALKLGSVNEAVLFVENAELISEYHQDLDQAIKGSVIHAEKISSNLKKNKEQAPIFFTFTRLYLRNKMRSAENSEQAFWAQQLQNCLFIEHGNESRNLNLGLLVDNFLACFNQNLLNQPNLNFQNLIS
jgi:DNA polymerase III delta prime subunit